MTDRIKYPRTLHLPWSPGVHNDDRVMSNVESFKGKNVVITEKMDGENTTMYCDHIHARSLDSGNHPSREWVKNFWARIKYKIPTGWRVCGENVYAKHSIHYTELPSYFIGFSIWNDQNICLSWGDTQEWFEFLGIIPVPVLYEGPFVDFFTSDKDFIDESHQEGYVIRYENQFPMVKFQEAVAKYVREKHVQTDQHWMHQQLIQNILK